MADKFFAELKSGGVTFVTVSAELITDSGIKDFLTQLGLPELPTKIITLPGCSGKLDAPFTVNETTYSRCQAPALAGENFWCAVVNVGDPMLCFHNTKSSKITVLRRKGEIYTDRPATESGYIALALEDSDAIRVGSKTNGTYCEFSICTTRCIEPIMV